MKLIMLSAMYENGGNVTHRHLDGHPELLVYPFESQPGTKLISDHLESMFPFKYRWPVFPLENSLEGDFELFFDEELKTRLRRPDGSKFRDADLIMDEEERKNAFIRIMESKTRTTGELVMAFFGATFETWRNLNKSGEEKYYVGYSPIIGVDADRIFSDLPNAKILHIVRNPLIAYAETCYRPFPNSLRRYIWIWNFVQVMSLSFQEKYPDRYIILHYEDLLNKKEETMRKLCYQLGLSFSDTLLYPSWNGKKLDDVYPWGTIYSPDTGEQEKRKSELSEEQIAEIRGITRLPAKELGYNI